MKVIYKYSLPTLSNTLIMPKGAEILSVQFQESEGCGALWAKVDTSKPDERRTFTLIGTGHPIDFMEGSNFKYLGTFQMDNGSLVWHVFELIN